jgi:hypothetical protein
MFIIQVYIILRINYVYFGYQPVILAFELMNQVLRVNSFKICDIFWSSEYALIFLYLCLFYQQRCFTIILLSCLLHIDICWHLHYSRRSWICSFEILLFLDWSDKNLIWSTRKIRIRQDSFPRKGKRFLCDIQDEHYVMSVYNCKYAWALGRYLFISAWLWLIVIVYDHLTYKNHSI